MTKRRMSLSYKEMIQRNDTKKTWDMPKNIHHKERKELVFGGHEAGCDWIAVKIPSFKIRFATMRRIDDQVGSQ